MAGGSCRETWPGLSSELWSIQARPQGATTYSIKPTKADSRQPGINPWWTVMLWTVLTVQTPLIGTETSLGNHLAGVAGRVNQFAESLKLPQKLRDDIGLAARLHDIGKVDPRFQSLMVGGDPVELEMRKEEPLAKSLPGVKRVATIPGTPRHEITSIVMLEAVPEALAGAHDKDLVLHLVATHHGWGRPFLNVVPDNDPQGAPFAFEGLTLSATADPASGSLALDMADRFWRLIERYGYHGLAWLEAILRLADHRQSAVEAEE